MSLVPDFRSRSVNNFSGLNEKYNSHNNKYYRIRSSNSCQAESFSQCYTKWNIHNCAKNYEVQLKGNFADTIKKKHADGLKPIRDHIYCHRKRKGKRNRNSVADPYFVNKLCGSK